MHSFKSDEFKIRVLTKDDAEEYNALLRYAFQVTEADLAETGWKDDEIKQSKFPVLERADVLGCFNIIDKKEELVAQFAVYPLDMNIYGERYEVGFVTSVCTYPEYTGHGLMKKLMRKSLTRMRDSNKSFALLYPYSIPLYRGSAFPHRPALRWHWPVPRRRGRYRSQRPQSPHPAWTLPALSDAARPKGKRAQSCNARRQNGA